MSEAEKTKRPFWKNPIVWAIIATGLVAAFGFWAGGLEACSVDFWGNHSCSGNKWSAFLQASPSEVGDTLAGFAGALAFVWLIATVVLQGQELREQRIEFSRMATAQDEKRFDAELEEILVLLTEKIRGSLSNGRYEAAGRVFWLSGKAHLFPTRIIEELEESERSEEFSTLASLTDIDLLNYFKSLFGIYDEDNVWEDYIAKSPIFHKSLREVQVVLEQILEIQDGLSPAQRRRIERNGWVGICKSLSSQLGDRKYGLWGGKDHK